MLFPDFVCKFVAHFIKQRNKMAHPGPWSYAFFALLGEHLYPKVLSVFAQVATYADPVITVPEDVGAVSV